MKFFDSPALKAFKEKLQKNENFKVPNLWGAPKALLSAFCSHTKGKQVVLVTSVGGESTMLGDLDTLCPSPCLDFPAWETLPSEKIEPSSDIVGERASVLYRLSQKKSKDVIVTSLQSLLVPLLSPKEFQHLFVYLKKGEEIDFQLLIEKLVSLGYERTTLVNDKGQFAVRGGIIDLFPSSETKPFRIEFFGDEVESIRAFDPVHQTSVEDHGELKIFQTKELKLLEDYSDHAHFFDYLDQDAVVILDDPFSIYQKYLELKKVFQLDSEYLFDFNDFLDRLKNFQHIAFESEGIHPYFKNLETLEVLLRPFDEVFPAKTKIVHENEQTYLIRLPKLGYDEYTFIYLCQSDQEEVALKEQMKAVYETVPNNVIFERGNLSSGWVIPHEKKAYISSSEVTQRYVIKRKKQRTSYHSAPIEFMELIVGDYVVHLQHGIGKYLGCERRKNHLGVETEYLNLEYAEGSRLFVPLDQSHLVSKYIGAKNELPKLHQIGGKSWLKTKVQTERAIVDYASELLRMYAERTLKEGEVYPGDSQEVVHFEEEFPYAETDDQLKAVEAIKEDLTSGKPMDRLVCGDVGYGKTEVAMRAAFKIVVDGGAQVAILVPTTILAMQHFETFCARMANFPINIAVLSRFVSRKQQKEYLEGLKNGSIDIVIGTHRVVSKDVTFKNLGLVIIDEEQRFGVKAKEHLRNMKVGVDCLTLSATPIPRTLYMSLVGARDISLINSPPQDRLPIQTHIIESDSKIIKNAILREVSREGQVYIVHNRVASIYRFAEKIQKMVPDAKILIGHGQMNADALDEVFHDFKNKKADILIATTIIESGVDIPNANTILIDHADKYGLADLYQLRGRVGRWNRKAYAYFMVQKNKSLLEIAQKRLSALMESSGYGGGMKIAMRDLEIRGAGEILGTSQSGHVSAIGFHLYCKLLKRTILSMQGKAPKTIIDTKIEFPVDTRLPDEYVPDLPLRMELYQRLGDAYKMEDLEVLFNEVQDRFGKPPLSVLWLYYMLRLKIFAGSYKITEIIYKKNYIQVEKRDDGKPKTHKIPYILGDDPALFEKEIISLLEKI